MRYFLAFPLIVLSGCMEPTPPQPSIAVQQLTLACQGGNMDACKSLAQIEQQNSAARSAALSQLSQNMANQPPIYTNTMSSRQPVRCTTYYNTTTCQ